MVDTIVVARKFRRLHTDLPVSALVDAIPRPPLLLSSLLSSLAVSGSKARFELEFFGTFDGEARFPQHRIV
jgi:hypothetical protein